MNGRDLNRGIDKETMEEIISQSPYNRHLGLYIRSWRPGDIEVGLTMRPDLTQFHGFAHGAVVGAVADVSCAWAAASVVGSVVTAEYKVNLIAPAVGQELIGRGRVIKASRRQVVCNAEVFSVNNGVEKIVAAALATIMPMPVDAGESPSSSV